METYLLFESATGYALFKLTSFDELGQGAALQQSTSDYGRFSRAVKLQSFQPFENAAQALEQINSISEGQVTELLSNFLALNLPKVKKKSKNATWTLGVSEHKLGNAISEACGVPCSCTEATGEVLRGVRHHFPEYVDKLTDTDLRKAQLGLGHSYSRAKVKFNVHKVDNMIIQAIALLDTLDRDINTFVMRVKEWYSWHFPELSKIVSDNYQFCKCALAIQDKAGLTVEGHQGVLTEILGDDTRAEEVIEASQTSMGQDISPIDLSNIVVFANKVIKLAEYRYKLHAYLQDSIGNVAPNLSTLLGEMVSARLISHAGSLTNLAKAPASTLQILGAEKALFRALKTRGNTPKYGLIFHTTFIGKAKAKNKGRISRYVANKASMAARIDAFSDFATNAFGVKLREQVEERLRFYDDGVNPRKNLEVMTEAVALAQENVGAAAVGTEARQPEEAQEASDQDPKIAKKRSKLAQLEAKQASGAITPDESKVLSKLRKKLQSSGPDGGKLINTPMQATTHTPANGANGAQVQDGTVSTKKQKRSKATVTEQEAGEDSKPAKKQKVAQEVEENAPASVKAAKTKKSKSKQSAVSVEEVQTPGSVKKKKKSKSKEPE